MIGWIRHICIVVKLVRFVLSYVVIVIQLKPALYRHLDVYVSFVGEKLSICISPDDMFLVPAN